jgi:hypothetical protein
MKTKNILLLILPILFITLFITSCYDGWNNIEGNYNVQTEMREFPAFNRVYNEGNFEVFVVHDSAYYAVIEAEGNLIPAIATLIKGSALEITTKDDLKNHYPMKIFVHTPDVHGIFLNGSGLIQAQEIETEFLELGISGSGHLEFQGNADILFASISGSGAGIVDVVADEVNGSIDGSGIIQFFGEASRSDFNISGSGEIRAYELPVDTCEAEISGSGNMYVNVQNLLKAKISGSGSVYYLGNPVVDSEISGSGSVIHP